jgi:hypothetical protein
MINRPPRIVATPAYFRRYAVVKWREIGQPLKPVIER